MPASLSIWGVTLVMSAFALDYVYASALTGLLACASMLGVLCSLLLRARWLFELAWGSSRYRPLLRFESALLIALLLVFAARLFVTWREMGPDGLSGAAVPSLSHAARLYDLLFAFLALPAYVLLEQTRGAAALLVEMARRPPLLLALSFLGLVLAGTLLLSMPIALRLEENISLLDALFTMTSAVCVTGLTINDVGTTYTFFGQLVILVGIQLGGIGIMTLAAGALALQRGASLRAQSNYAAMFSADSLADLRAMLRSVAISTIAVECTGALCLWLLWSGNPQLEGQSTAWYALFHAISAFCNAGFALFPRNLEFFSNDGPVQIVIMLLIVFGGLGFPVYRELFAQVREWIERRLLPHMPPARKLSFSSALVLRTSCFLVGLGFVGIWLFEWGRPALGADSGERLFGALFTSVTARTAGFNTLEIGELRDTSLLLVMALMFIGGSPASTAGGIKTSTLAVLYASLRAELRGEEPTLMRRTLSAKSIWRATAVSFTMAFAVFTTLTLLTLVERNQPFLALAFETVSALGTVGLSTGITPDLGAIARFVLIGAMFVGRLGPLTVALSVGGRRKHRPLRWPQEDLELW